MPAPALPLFVGPIGNQIKLAEDEDGHRTYTVPFRVQGTPGVHGPNSARKCVNDHVPVGTTWGTLYNAARTRQVLTAALEVDACAWRRPTTEVNPDPKTKEGEQPEFWVVTCTFSTRPQRDGGERCFNDDLCLPWDEPQKVSIDHSNYTEEASFDRFGRRVLSSSLEPIHGQNNEWEFTHTSVTIEQTVLDPQIPLVEQMKDHVNAYPLWGLPPRTIRFRPAGYQRRCIMLPAATGSPAGVYCQVYWTRKLNFEMRYRVREGFGARAGTGTGVELTPVPGGPYETWDRNVWDEGTRVLRGYWSDAAGHTGTGTHYRSHWREILINGLPPDPTNPQHFIRFKDWNGENTKTLLDGHGRPAFVPYVEDHYWVVYYQYVADFIVNTSVNIIHVPCLAALRHLQNIQTELMLGPPALYGPYGTRAAAEAAVQSFYVANDPTVFGTPVAACPDTTPSVGVVHIERYGQADFRLLGIPTNLSVMSPPFALP